jgi:cation:H+ antiporter
VDFLTSVLFLLGFVLLIVGAEMLVRGASRLATAAGISAYVVGLTVVAYGTSAPEVAVTLQSAYANPPQPDIAVGNVVGSNISNVLLVLGISAVVAPLIVSRNVVRTGMPLMIGVSVFLWLLALDGEIGRLDGAVFFAGSIIYTVVAVVRSRSHTRRARAQDGDKSERSGQTAGVAGIVMSLVLVGAGLAALVLGSRWLVKGAVDLAEYFGVSKLIIGLTVVAVGTSLPEIATSVVAVIRGQRDLAVGNVIGSNVFNVLMVLGLCGLFAPGGVAVSPTALRFDIPVMVAVAVACLPVFFFDDMITRWEGGIFLLYYAAYVTYLCLEARQHELLQGFTQTMVFVVAPLTALTFFLYWCRLYMRKRGNPS